MHGILPRNITAYTAETKICLQPDHMHRDPHVDILSFEIGGHSVVVESERWSLIFNVHVDDHLVRQEINSTQLDEYMKGLQP
jgi:hypothetical protein